MTNKAPKNTKFLFSSLFADFGVRTEQQLLDKMEEESQNLYCFCCGKEVSIYKVKFVDDEPYCGRCFGNC